MASGAPSSSTAKGPSRWLSRREQESDRQEGTGKWWRGTQSSCTPRARFQLSRALPSARLLSFSHILATSNACLHAQPALHQAQVFAKPELGYALAASCRRCGVFLGLYFTGAEPPAECSRREPRLVNGPGLPAGSLLLPRAFIVRCAQVTLRERERRRSDDAAYVAMSSRASHAACDSPMPDAGAAAAVAAVAKFGAAAPAGAAPAAVSRPHSRDPSPAAVAATSRSRRSRWMGFGLSMLGVRTNVSADEEAHAAVGPGGVEAEAGEEGAAAGSGLAQQSQGDSEDWGGDSPMRDVDGDGMGGDGGGGGGGGGGVDAGEMEGDNGSMDDEAWIQSMGADEAGQDQLPEAKDEAAGCVAEPTEGAASMGAAEPASREDKLADAGCGGELAASVCSAAPVADAAGAAEPDTAASPLLPPALPWGIRSHVKEIRCAAKGSSDVGGGAPACRCSGATFLGCAFSSLYPRGPL